MSTVGAGPQSMPSGDAQPVVSHPLLLQSPLLNRRRLLIGGASGAAVAIAGGALVVGSQGPAVDRTGPEGAAAGDAAAGAAGPGDPIGTTVEPFYGAHQAGIATVPQALVTFAAFDLRSGVDGAALGRLLRILTDDIGRLTAGVPALADTAPELAVAPARLTVTVGFGPALFDKLRLASRRPAGFTELPPFRIDALEARYSGGDLLLQICADDGVTVSHALRMLLKDTRTFATPRWFQRGFRSLPGSAPADGSTRNLMGQVDGTVNPTAAADLDRLVWHQGPGWFTGGTTLVLRRIRMNLDSWDALPAAEMEEAVGRRLSDGAPLSGGTAQTPPDFTAPDASGLPAIAAFAHIRQARGNGPAPEILRHPYNFDDSPDQHGGSDLGLLFTSYQANLGQQYLPIQSRLATNDLLNQWTTPVGSAVFALPPGCAARRHAGPGAPRLMRGVKRRADLRTVISVVVISCAMGVGAVFGAATASAHDVLVSSDPAAGAVLLRPPGRVMLEFDQQVRSEFAEMAVTIGTLPPVQFTPTISGRTVSADLASLHPPGAHAPGSPAVPWKIGYRIVSADGHPVTGVIGFTVGTAAAAPSSAAPTQTRTQTATSSNRLRWGLSALLCLVVGTAGGVGITVARRRRRSGSRNRG